MNTIEGNSDAFNEGLFESTQEPRVSVIAEQVSTLTVGTILGVSIVVLIAIVMVFVLGVLIDRRHQRLLNEKIAEVKRKKNYRKRNIHPGIDVVSIADNMEEPSISVAPAESLRHVP